MGAFSLDLDNPNSHQVGEMSAIFQRVEAAHKKLWAVSGSTGDTTSPPAPPAAPAPAAEAAAEATAAEATAAGTATPVPPSEEELAWEAWSRSEPRKPILHWTTLFAPLLFTHAQSLSYTVAREDYDKITQALSGKLLHTVHDFVAKCTFSHALSEDTYWFLPPFEYFR